MKKLKLGLAANKTSYFDPLTNTYITLEKPVVDVHYENYKVLKNITHAILSSVPALVLYEGKLPEEAIKEWEERYMKPFRTDMSKLRRALTGDMVPPAVRANRAFDRADRIKDESIDFPEAPTEEPVTQEPATEEPVTQEPVTPEPEERNDTVVQQSVEPEDNEAIELFPEEEAEEEKPKTKTKKGTKSKKSEK
ncbi:hypothetical protein B14_200225 (plasmid) [Bacillus licheniformis]|uniref:hypothetical protein n=1 Tax=Bacillus licheniformis TaxID=1402 RepID=UPI0009B7BC3B|nr:hypothetical protein [Bacillus licheniformis]ARC67436.1 hypothetical protein B14_200225 [Bacillus licheniformis]ARW46155.1 hypothetical protein S100141_04937 [Bacillus licheniformis]MDE1421866.1 hypothetical protein [Bacillus licheniformis]MEC0475871.1 hypothetical protein [Bacillus licheniformis]RHL11931.1 hypothetical protein DW032_20085 [Bacillus licheniformis]